jgi:hypothetical protein
MTLSSLDHASKLSSGWIFVTVFFLFSFSQAGVTLGSDLQVTFTPGYANLERVGTGQDGMTTGLEVNTSLSPFWSIFSGGNFSHHFQHQHVDSDDTTKTIDVTDIITYWIGARYALDLFIIVPYLGLAPAVIHTLGDPPVELNSTEFALRGTFGFDYRPEPHFSVGLELSSYTFFRDFLSAPDYMTAVLRLSWHHDFFSLH